MICVCKVNPCVWPACPAGEIDGVELIKQYIVTHDNFPKVIKNSKDWYKEVNMESKRHKKLDAIEFDRQDIVVANIQNFSLKETLFTHWRTDKGNVTKYKVIISAREGDAFLSYEEEFNTYEEALSVYNELITIWKDYLDNKDK